LEFGSLPLMPGRYELSIALSDPADPWIHYDVLYKLFYVDIAPEEDWDPVAPLELAPTVEQVATPIGPEDEKEEAKPDREKKTKPF
jgi:hypothetical protein